MKLFFSTLFLTSLALLACDNKQEVNATPNLDEVISGYEGYRLVWSDEFDYEGHPDSTRWAYEKGYVRNKETQYYTEKRLENCRVENGTLVIEARHENPKYEGAEFTSASILTSGIAAWKYGRIEARVKVPVGQGAWPAFWMKGLNQFEQGVKWPYCGEIDILEYVGIEPNTAWQTVHFFEEKNKYVTRKTPLLNPLSDDFHVFGIDWDETKINFYIDGIVTHSFDTTTLKSEDNPFNQPFFLLLNLALGSYEQRTMAGELDPSILPIKYEVDYVRVYEKIK